MASEKPIEMSATKFKGSEIVIRGLKFLPLKFKGSETTLRGPKYSPKKLKGLKLGSKNLRGLKKLAYPKICSGRLYPIKKVRPLVILGASSAYNIKTFFDHCEEEERGKHALVFFNFPET